MSALKHFVIGAEGRRIFVCIGGTFEAPTVRPASRKERSALASALVAHYNAVEDKTGDAQLAAPVQP